MNSPHLDPFGDYQKAPRTIGFIIIGIIIVLILLFSDGCVSPQVITRGQVYSVTGTYNVYEADCGTVQYMHQYYGGNPRITVSACTIWTKEGKRQIWYCTQEGLEEELHNIQSYRNLINAHKYDERKWLQIVPPIGK